MSHQHNQSVLKIDQDAHNHYHQFSHTINTTKNVHQEIALSVQLNSR